MDLRAARGRLVEMKISIDLSPAQVGNSSEARRNGSASHRRTWRAPSLLFSAAAERVLKKNEELYRRLV